MVLKKIIYEANVCSFRNLGHREKKLFTGEKMEISISRASQRGRSLRLRDLGDGGSRDADLGETEE